MTRQTIDRFVKLPCSGSVDRKSSWNRRNVCFVAGIAASVYIVVGGGGRTIGGPAPDTAAAGNSQWSAARAAAT